MRVTVFTSNQPRHTALINALAGVADQVYAVQECNTVFPGAVADFFRKSAVMQDYFQRVIAAEQAVFGGPKFTADNVTQLPIKMGDLNRLELSLLGPALEADAFIVFGASYIKGPLCEHLVARRCYNIHMGVSPYYRGSSTNFWALFDGQPEFVGATIHLLTAGLDSGPMLFHALPPAEPTEPFALGMRAVQAAQQALVARLASGEISGFDPISQDKSQQHRYTRNADFTDAVAEAYLASLPSAADIGATLAARDLSRFVRPYVPAATHSAPRDASLLPT
jgi:hypothetical protein